MIIGTKAMRKSLLATLLALAPLSVRASAADDPLRLLPDTTLGFAVIHRLSELNDKLAQHAQRLGIPGPDLLTLAKMSAGAQQGLDEQGSLLVAAIASVDGSNRIEESEALIAVPVTDYQQFVEQFPGDASAEIAELLMAGAPVLVTEVPGYALITPQSDEHRTLLESLRKREPSLEIDVDGIEDWVAGNDVIVALLPSGIQNITQRAATELEQVQEQLADSEELGDAAAQVTAAFDMYLQALRFANTEITMAADGLRIDDNGDFRFGGRLRFAKSGLLSHLPANLNHRTADLLADLPGGPFTGVMGAAFTEECSDLLAEWSAAMVKNNPGIYQLNLSDEAAEKYEALSRASMQGMRGWSMKMSAGAEGESILGGLLGIVDTDNSAEYLQRYGSTVEEVMEVLEESAESLPYDMQVEPAEVAGLKGLKVVTDITAALEAQGGPPEAMEMFETMFGEGGKMTAHMLPVDEQSLLFSYGHQRTIRSQIESLQDGSPMLTAEASVTEALARLPAQAGLVALVNPHRAVAWAQRIAADVAPGQALGELPPFPETPAIAFSARSVAGGLETELVIPAELPQAVMGFVQQIQQQQLQQQ